MCKTPYAVTRIPAMKKEKHDDKFFLFALEEVDIKEEKEEEEEEEHHRKYICVISNETSHLVAANQNTSFPSCIPPASLFLLPLHPPHPLVLPLPLLSPFTCIFASSCFVLSPPLFTLPSSPLTLHHSSSSSLFVFIIIIFHLPSSSSEWLFLSVFVLSAFWSIAYTPPS